MSCKIDFTGTKLRRYDWLERFFPTSVYRIMIQFLLRTPTPHIQKDSKSALCLDLHMPPQIHQILESRVRPSSQALSKRVSDPENGQKRISKVIKISDNIITAMGALKLGFVLSNT